MNVTSPHTHTHPSPVDRNKQWWLVLLGLLLLSTFKSPVWACWVGQVTCMKVRRTPPLAPTLLLITE